MEVAILLALGLVAGTISGLVGVGGSIVIIPVLTVVLGRNQHLSQASAMIVNVLVAAASMLQHQRAGAIRWDVAGRMLPAGVVCIVAGVAASNVLDATLLMRIYGVFLIYVIAFNVMRLLEERRAGCVAARRPRTGWGYAGAVGGSMGFVAGLLGIGGAPISIPLLQRLCRLSLRQAIAATSAVMVLTAAVGAAGKNATLSRLADAQGHSLGLRAHDSLLIAAALAPTAVIGAMAGARLVHVLPVRWVRLAFILLMIWASAEMLGLV